MKRVIIEITHYNLARLLNIPASSIEAIHLPIDRNSIDIRIRGIGPDLADGQEIPRARAIVDIAPYLRYDISHLLPGNGDDQEKASGKEVVDEERSS